jgi:hypothetical protein
MPNCLLSMRACLAERVEGYCDLNFRPPAPKLGVPSSGGIELLIFEEIDSYKIVYSEFGP